MLSKILLIFHSVILCLVLMQNQVVADDDRESDDSSNISPSLEAARKAVDDKDFESALGHLTIAEKETPDNADVHNLLGYSYRKLGKIEKAFDHYRVALKADPKHRGAHEYIGELYLELDQLTNAQKHLAALDKACFWGCEEYDDLKKAVEKYKTKKGATQ